MELKAEYVKPGSRVQFGNVAGAVKTVEPSSLHDRVHLIVVSDEGAPIAYELHRDTTVHILPPLRVSTPAEDAWEAYKTARSAGPRALTSMGKAQQDAFVAGWIARAAHAEAEAGL